MANDYYSLRNYDNFCFFCAISKSTKMHDEFAFFIFFTFKSWKRLILADGPRQAINAIILFSFAKANNFQTSNLSVYWDNSVITLLLLLAMLATLLIFICSFVLLIVAAVGYVPLLCYIQGNLKVSITPAGWLLSRFFSTSYPSHFGCNQQEYVCHKVDKRIAHLIKKKGVERAKRAADLEKQQGRPTKNGESKQGLPQPTLSSFVIEDDKHFQPRKQQVSGPGHVGSRPGLMPTSNSQQSLDPNHQYWNQNHTAAAAEYSHNDYGYPPQPQPLYANDSYGSTTHLTEAAANPGFAYPDPRVAYPGIAYVENPTLPRALSPTPPLPFHSSPYWSHEQEQQQYRDSSQAVAPPTHRQRQGSYDSYNPPSQSQSNLPLTQTNLYLASRDRYQLSHSPMYSADLRSSAQPANYEGGLGAIPQVDPDFFYDQAAAPAYAAHGSHQQSQDEKAIYKPSSSSRNDGQDFSRSMFRSGSGPGGNESREGSSLAYNRQ